MPDWLLFLVPSLIWGTTWLVIKFQLGVVAPEVSVAYRFGLASMMIFGWCALRGISVRFDARTHGTFALQGLLQYALNYVLVYLAERSLPSGVVAVVFVLMVPWNLAGARIFFGRSPTAPVIVGAVIGVGGVALVFLPELSRVRASPGEAVGLLLAVLATAVSSAGNLWSERVYGRKIALVPSTAWAMLYGASGVGAYSALRSIPFAFERSFRYMASLAYLALFGSVFAFLAFLTLLKRVGSGRAGYTAAITPVLAMLTSTLFERYRWSGSAIAGMAFVLSGQVLVLRGRALSPATAKARRAA